MLADLRWRFWAWLSGVALVKAGQAALDRGDDHEAAHIVGMVQIGDSSRCADDCVAGNWLALLRREWEQRKAEGEAAPDA